MYGLLIITVCDLVYTMEVAKFVFLGILILSAILLTEEHQLEPLDIFFYAFSDSKSNPQPETTGNPSMEVENESKVSCGDLEIEESCILFQSYVDYEIQFQYQNLECENCSMISSKPLTPHGTQKIILDFVSFGTTWQVVNLKTNGTVHNATTNFLGEQSEYKLVVNNTSVYLIQEHKPEHIFTPIFVAIGIYVLLAVLWIAGNFLHKKKLLSVFHRPSAYDLETAYSTSSTVEDKKQKQARKRIRALDTVRGIAIVVMIFVNYGGGKYWFFDHALWNGLTVADLVFPWFIWMMGMSMALSMRSLLRKAVPRRKIFYKIVKRSVILFALGLMLNTYCLVVDVKQIRIPGVLQRFSISYFVVATVHMCFAKTEDANQSSCWAPVRDIVAYWIEWLIMLSLLLVHILITFLVHAPGCPVGYLGPGGMHDQGQYELCTGGAAGYIDRVVLGTNHIYQHPTFKKLYGSTLPYDPEGILGFLTSIFLVFLGLQAGKILLTYTEWKQRVLRWMSWAVLLGILSLALTNASQNDGVIPINKNMWSVSYIFSTGSMGFVLMALCYYFIDIKNWWTGAPFYYAGMNSILLYVGHSITSTMFPWSWKVHPNHAEELFVDLWGTSLWVLIALWMFHIDFFVAV